MSAAPVLALIAEDEPLLAQALQAELARLWPALRFLPIAPDGESAVAAALSARPQLLFLDIRMPGLSGLDAAQAIVEDWPDGEALPLIVFVTAYDQHAVEAFEHAAVDYVLKPAEPARLARTCERLQALLRQRERGDQAGGGLPETALAQLHSLLAGANIPASAPLRMIQAGVGNTIHLLPVTEVLYFEAADKYVRVVTATRELLIRSSLRELLPQLDGTLFWQVHRGTVVRADAIASALRDDSGRLQLTLAGRPEKLAVSRLYAARFKAM